MYEQTRYPIHNNTGSDMPVEIPPVRAPQIEVEYMELQAALDMLLEKMAGLNARLRPVTRQSGPMSGEEKQLKEIQLVPLAENIRRLRNKVNQGHGIIDDLMERLEI